MASEFGWSHNFWRMPPRGPGMGWREFSAWLGALNRIRRGKETDPDTWDGVDQDPFFQEQWRLREERRQRDAGFLNR